MKLHNVFTLLFAWLALCGMARDVQDFNFNWKFKLGDFPHAAHAQFDDSQWRVVRLPHDWSIEQNYTTEQTAGSTGFLPAGIGWYRKTFDVPANWENTITHIEFDGVYRDSEVWINGQYLGKRPFGYIAFAYELTKHLNYGGKNTISVRVDHSKFADSRWYGGSGIYRDVRLVNTAKLYVPTFGAWAETPKVSSKSAQVTVSAVVVNATGSAQKTQVQVLLKNQAGQVVAQTKKRITARGRDTLSLQLRVKQPQLWSLSARNRYTAEVLLSANKKQLDSYSLTFGIRSIRFDANQGFFLNEQNVKLKGVCLHHDAGAVGAAFVEDVWRRRLLRLKEIGVNAIRSAHNPASPKMLTLCDELGFLVINESFDEWKRNKEKWITSRFAKDMRPGLSTGYGDLFEQWGERDVKDMVRYSRNHPSIIMWSIGNEIEWTYPYYWKMEKSNQGLGNQVLQEETLDGKDELKETAVMIQQWVKDIDKSRFVTTGGVLPRAGNITGYFDVLDVMGYNYRASHYDEDHKNYPNRIIYGSENWGTYQEWKDVKDRDFVSGLFLWTGIAYLGESGPFPWKGLEISLLDFAAFYTPRGHFFKTLWSEKPYTYVATQHAKKAQWKKVGDTFVDNRVRFWLDKWLFEDVEETWNYEKGDSVFVEVFSNSPVVELFVNNKSYGKKTVSDFDDHIVKYLVPYASGELKAVGLNQNKAASEYRIKTAKWINKIELHTDKTQMKADGYAVAHIEARVCTPDGSIVPDKDVQLEFTIEGEGKNIGVDNGWDRNVQSHKSNYIVTHAGKALLLVQSTRKTGTIKISAKAGAWKSNVITIQTQ